MPTNKMDNQNMPVNDSDDEFAFNPEKLKRVPREQRHLVSAQDVSPRNTKIRITTYLDQDIFDFFKARASAPGAEPYQTQINQALRTVVANGGLPLSNYATEICAWCKGKGNYRANPCQSCGGHGYVAVLQQSHKCVQCYRAPGSGLDAESANQPCKYCRGTGWFGALVNKSVLIA